MKLTQILEIYTKILARIIGWLFQVQNNRTNSDIQAKKYFTFFKKGIFGSPNSKIEIFNREISNKNILRPAIYL